MLRPVYTVNQKKSATFVCKFQFRSVLQQQILLRYNYIMSGFGGHISMSSCRSWSQSLVHILFMLCMIENSRFAVGNSMLSVHSFRDMSISGFGSHLWLSVIFDIVQGLSLSRHNRKPVVWMLISVILSEIEVFQVWAAILLLAYFRLSVVFEITVFEMAMVGSPMFSLKRNKFDFPLK